MPEGHILVSPPFQKVFYNQRFFPLAGKIFFWTVVNMKLLVLFFLSAITYLDLLSAPRNFAGTYLTADDPQIPFEFHIQGEYKSQEMGAQVISLDKGGLQVVVYPGGLPGAGWDGKNKSLLHGKLSGKEVKLTPATGERKYLAGPAGQFSATRQFPPVGHKLYSGNITGKKLTLLEGGQTKTLKKIFRKSPTLHKKPPQNAIVLFDGTDKKEFQGGRLDDQTKLLNTDGKDIRTVRKFSNYNLHLEFMLPFRPASRGQGRGNSGLYQIDMYENQILDSFGLEGLHNECGGIYSIKDSKVNACLPPLSWQTYDVDFTNAVAKKGKKIKNARLTARLNGILIHDNFEIPNKTGGSRPDAEGTAGPIKLQGHGNPLQFRNIWILEK